MSFSRRIKLFLFGIVLGLIFVYFSLFKGRDRDLLGWLPQERVLQKLKESELIYTDRSFCIMDCNDISQEEIEKIILAGEVNFGKSKEKDSSCPVYALEGTVNNRMLVVMFATCDTTTTVADARDINNEVACDCD